ncbi:hypothetical protein QQ020_31435 [Fulvivirgaceae bacterium BMA12]|uniref:DUF2335 domain-containing protein n=1 Tax=Agaribacillus aureus TaxID=3051825 RepID=A0ABT8LFQ8_9BACT|nr:hypothetical protein [Fulvivirgaceae bacterium BMA12]
MKEEPEIEKDTGKGAAEEASSYVPGKPYSKLRRELADEDLSNPAVQKLLISEIDKLEIRVSALELVETNYHRIDKEKAVLEEKLRTHNSLEVLYSFCLAIGSGLIGLASLFKIEEKGWIFLVSGGILIIGGISSKLVKKWS